MIHRESGFDLSKTQAGPAIADSELLPIGSSTTRPAMTRRCKKARYFQNFKFSMSSTTSQRPLEFKKKKLKVICPSKSTAEHWPVSPNHDGTHPKSVESTKSSFNYTAGPVSSPAEKSQKHPVLIQHRPSGSDAPAKAKYT